MQASRKAVHPGESQKVRVNPLSFCALIQLMMQGPCTYVELTNETGLHHKTVRKWVAEMKRSGLVHVAAWEPTATGQYNTPCFAWAGNKPKADVTRPQPKNRATIARECRTRKLLNQALHATAGSSRYA